MDRDRCWVGGGMTRSEMQKGDADNDDSEKYSQAAQRMAALISSRYAHHCC